MHGFFSLLLTCAFAAQHNNTLSPKENRHDEYIIRDFNAEWPDMKIDCQTNSIMVSPSYAYFTVMIAAGS